MREEGFCHWNKLTFCPVLQGFESNCLGKAKAPESRTLITKPAFKHSLKASELEKSELVFSPQA